jgi:hypothetical protein
MLFVFQTEVIPPGVPAAWGRGLDRFPLTRGCRSRFVVVRSVGIIAQECFQLATKRSNSCFASIITQKLECTAKHRTKDRSRHRAAETNPIVSSLSRFRLPWLQRPPTSAFVSNWRHGMVAKSCSRQASSSYFFDLGRRFLNDQAVDPG